MNFEKLIVCVLICFFPTCIALPIITSTSGEDVSKIMRGLTANRGKFPYQALIIRNHQLVCGGSILSKKFILTAAHCTDTTSLYKVAVGVHDSANLSERSVQIFSVKNIIIHDEFWENKTCLENDIAILELENEIKLNNYVTPVKLAGINEDFTGSVIVSGWGWNEENKTTLQELTAPLVPNDRCRSLWENPKYKRRITNEMLCFGEEGRDVCRGDSGGPMMCSRSDNTSVQCGIVSFGKTCKKSWLPGVQTRVASFIVWIEKIIGGKPSLSRRIDQAEPLTSKSAEFILRLAYNIFKQADDHNLKTRFPKSIQDLIWPSICRIKNVETGHFMKVVKEEQVISNGSTLQVYHMVGEDVSLTSPNWRIVPDMIQNNLRFRIYNQNFSKFMNDERDEGFVQDRTSALQYEIHFENDQVPSSTEQQPFYIFSPGKNVYFHEARRSWEPWRCGFNQSLDCLVTSEPGKKYDEGKFVLEGCVALDT